MTPVAVGQSYPGGLAGITPRVGLQLPTGEPPKVGPGEVVFVTTKPAIILRCRLGAASATAAGGVGGWHDVERPGRENALEWGSLPGRTLTVPLLFDGLAEHRSIEAEIAALRTMGAPPKGSPRGTPPPVIRVGGMVQHEDRQWVLMDVTEGEAVWDGHRRIRLWASVTLAEYEDIAVVTISSKKSSATVATKVYVVKLGESLGEIARDQMGAKTSSSIARGVATLKQLNGIRDAKSIKAGDRLKVPR